MRRPPPIDRVSADDLMALVAAPGATPAQVGVVLLLDATGLDPAGLDPAGAIEQLGRRVAAMPRLRQRLVPVPVGCGRPIWVDDPGFDIEQHVSAVQLPGSTLPEQAVLERAAALLAAPLPRNRPLWAARLVTTAGGSEAALILVIHHVLADGVGGLAVLGGFVDANPTPGTVEPEAPQFPRSQPTRRQLAADAARGGLRNLGQLPRAMGRLAAAAGQLRPLAAGRLARTSLNVPTGPRRELASIRMPLARVLAAARAQGATVNDVLLVAIAAALHRLLAHRGENLDTVVVSVPFSSRRQLGRDRLGNESGVIPLRIPAVGDPEARLRQVAELTRRAKRGARGASTALIGPLFRLLSRLGFYRRFIDRQRLIHTFISNVRGPADAHTLLGFPITAMLPLSAPTGNVTVAFTVLSSAGTLAITLVADPDSCPDLARLRSALAEELAALMVEHSRRP